MIIFIFLISYIYKIHAITVIFYTVLGIVIYLQKYFLNLKFFYIFGINKHHQNTSLSFQIILILYINELVLLQI